MSAPAVALARWDGGALPIDFGDLAAAASAEGYRMLERLTEECRPDSTERPLLLIFASRDGNLAGCGGLTRDPYDPAPGRLRMRHFYVMPAARRHGLARRIAQWLIDQRPAGISSLTLRAADGRAARFWEAMAFRAVEHPSRTHELRFD